MNQNVSSKKISNTSTGGDYRYQKTDNFLASKAIKPAEATEKKQKIFSLNSETKHFENSWNLFETQLKQAGRLQADKDAKKMSTLKAIYSRPSVKELASRRQRLTDLSL